MRIRGTILGGLCVAAGVAMGAWAWSAKSTSEKSGESDIAARDESNSAGAMRIVALAPSSVEIVCALGACGQLVGVGSYTTYPPEVRSLPNVGGLYDPDLERILTLRPDVLITRGRSDLLSQFCNKHRIRVYEDPADRLADIDRAVREIGGLIGRREEAVNLCKRMADGLDAIRGKLADAPRVRVLLTLEPFESGREITTVGQGPYLTDLVEIAGGTNVFGDVEVAYPQVGPEEVLARQPEVILELTPGRPSDAAAQSAALARWRALGSIPAVKTGRVHVLTEDYLVTPSSRIVQTARRFAACLHPEAVPDE